MILHLQVALSGCTFSLCRNKFSTHLRAIPHVLSVKVNRSQGTGKPCLNSKQACVYGDPDFVAQGTNERDSRTLRRVRGTGMTTLQQNSGTLQKKFNSSWANKMELLSVLCWTYHYPLPASKLACITLYLQTPSQLHQLSSSIDSEDLKLCFL